MPVVILAGNTIDTGTIQILYPIDFGFEFSDRFCHVIVNRRAVLQSTVDDSRKFIAGHGTLPFKFTVGVSYQKAPVGQ